MAELNKLQMQVFGRKTIIPEPNTFFEYIGDVITSKEELRPLLTGISLSNIKFFEVANQNVICRINKDFGLANNAFRSGAYNNTSHIKGIYNTDGKLKNLGDGHNSYALNGARGCNRIQGFGITEIGRQSTQNISTKLLYLPSLNNALGRSFGAFGEIPFNRLYAPILTALTTPFDSASYAGKKAYLNPYLQTNNSGGIDAEVQSFITKGGTVIWLTDMVNIPDNITDLSVSDIAATSVKLNFTPPSSVNPVEFYEVWIDDGTNNPRQLYSEHQEILASGAAITGLITGKTYKVKIAACDSYWNGSGYADYRGESSWSNEITFTTL